MILKLLSLLLLVCWGFPTANTLTYNNTAGVVFTPEPPVIIASSLEAAWITIPFPSPPALNVTHLDIVFQEFQYKSRKSWKPWGGNICANEEITDATFNVTFLGLKNVEKAYLEVMDDLAEMRERAQTFIRHRDIHPDRDRRGALTVLLAGVAATAAAITLLPRFLDDFCPFTFMCGDSGKYDELAKRLSEVDDLARTVNLETGERIHLLGHSLNRTQGRVRVLAKDANENFRNLRAVFNRLSDGTSWDKIADICGKREREFVEAAQWTLSMMNHTQYFDTLLAEILDYQVGLHNFGYVLDDALAALAKGFIPAALIPPKALLKVLNNIQVDGMQEAIPRTELSAYYGFELVENVVLTDESINVLLNIPMHFASGAYRVYKAVAIPQPIDDGNTATRYIFKQNQFLQSNRRDSFAEATEQQLTTHCQGTSRLRLCLRPVAMSRSSKSSCLASLFFNLQNTALKLCPQEVVALPEEPVAEYLGDSTYLLTSRSTAYQLYNYTGGRAVEGERIRGCKSCLLRPACNGRIETPDGSLVLNPDPRKCHHEAGLHITIKQNTVLASMFTLFEEIQEQNPDWKFKKEYRAVAHEDLLKGLKMNLIELPEDEIDDEEIKKISRPFAEAILKRHAPFHWKEVAHPVVGTVLLTLLALFLLAVVGVMIYLGPRQFFEMMLTLCPCKRAQEKGKVIVGRTGDSTVEETNNTEMKEMTGTGSDGSRPERKEDTSSGNIGAPTNSQKADNIVKTSGVN